MNRICKITCSQTAGLQIVHSLRVWIQEHLEPFPKGAISLKQLCILIIVYEWAEKYSKITLILTMNEGVIKCFAALKWFLAHPHITLRPYHLHQVKCSPFDRAPSIFVFTLQFLTILMLCYITHNRKSQDKQEFQLYWKKKGNVSLVVAENILKRWAQHPWSLSQSQDFWVPDLWFLCTQDRL